MKATTIAFVSLFLIEANQTFAQTDVAKLASAAERIIEEQEPEFALERTAKGDRQINKVWKTTAELDLQKPSGARGAGGPFVEVLMFRLESEAEAAFRLKEIAKMTSISPVGSVEGLGDESLLWTGSSPTGATSIRFRKANLMMWVSASSHDLADRFAFHMLKAVDERLSAEPQRIRPGIDGALVEKVIATLDSDEPNWPLNNPTNLGGHLIMLLKERPEETGHRAEDSPAKPRLTSIQVFSYGSVEEASEELAASIKTTSASGGSPLSDLGDEALLWGSEEGGAATIRFRQGNLMIWVSGPTFELTRRFAEHVANSVVEYKKANEAKKSH